MHFMTPKPSLMAAAALLAITAMSASAATFDQDATNKLQAQAAAAGAVPVMVHLLPTTLQQLHDSSASMKATIADRKAKLLSELGNEAKTGGRWDNGIGQIGLYVTPAGLKILAASANAVAVFPGNEWWQSSKLNASDGRHQAIASQIAAQGYADVVVTLDVDGLEFDTARDGTATLRTSPAVAADASAKALSLFGNFTETELQGRQTALTKLSRGVNPDGSNVRPESTVRVTLDGLLKLVDSKLVRKIAPVGFADVRPTIIDPELLLAAQKTGTVDVIITVRNPYEGGHNSKASLDGMVASNRRTLLSVLAGAGVQSKLQDYSTFATMSGRLTVKEIASLKAANDPRLLSIELNKPMAQATLATAMATINMPPIWAAGFRAAGQNLVILDTGVQRNHVFFRNASGVSRVGFEACFGSNGSNLNGVALKTVCPSADPVTGDSPLGLAGSAAPVLGCMDATTPNAAVCHHGTHVTGIAAGRASTIIPAGLQGVAPDAGIVAVQVFSFDPLKKVAPVAFTADIVAAMQAVVSAMSPGTNNPFTVNLSLGSGKYDNACPNVSTAFTSAVSTLKSFGVPVVAATGNDGAIALAWPSCVPGVIKVSSVHNDGVGNTRYEFANISDPVYFSNDPLWLAPGGGGGTSVVSSLNNTSINSVGGISGTSQAAPQAAGLYAALKAAAPGISVNDASAWIAANASTPVAVDVCAVGPCGPSSIRAFKRLRLPSS